MSREQGSYQQLPEPEKPQSHGRIPQPAPQTERRTMQRFCRNCGSKIDAGASVCVHCNCILNPVAVQKAQQMVLDRKAVVTKAMLLKSTILPFSGLRIYRENRLNRPQVAKPCRKAAWLGMALWAAAIAIIILL